MVEGIAHLVSATAGEHLRELEHRFDNVWCTGWEERADEHLPGLLGLAHSYPYLTFERSPGQVHAHWKLAAIDAYAGARPLAWVDDAHDDACREWARGRERSGAPTLLVTTDPAVGLTGEHVRALTGFAELVSATSG